MPAAPPYALEPPYYPIVYVRGYAMTHEERESTFHDVYYGFAATSVEKRNVTPEEGYFALDIFEGQLIRFMKAHNYVDASNYGLDLCAANPALNPSRSLWVSRFYDKDYLNEKVRSIEEHAADLQKTVCQEVPAALEACGMDLGGPQRTQYKVILLAHSMGGLVCRTLIQNLFPRAQQDPKRWIHRLVTIGTPHKGIDLGTVPDVLENFLAHTLNPFDANIFQEERMRMYLMLEPEEELHSLGSKSSVYAFPPSRCLCIIGSDYRSYGSVRKVTGGHSDGLVKQDRAYIKDAYYANVHRAHSGYRGIVNSYESFENIRRFLFGNIRVTLTLEAIQVNTNPAEDCEDFYDFEFFLSIRGTGVYLHRKAQDPCENAMRFARAKVPQSLELHTGFMNSHLKLNAAEPFSHFQLKLRVVEHRTKPGVLWDREYPERPIYNETLELRVGDADPKLPGDEVQYRWLSDATDADWQPLTPDGPGMFHLPLRPANAFSAQLHLTAAPWGQD